MKKHLYLAQYWEVTKGIQAFDSGLSKNCEILVVKIHWKTTDLAIINKKKN